MKLCKDCVHAIPVITGLFGRKEYNAYTRCKKVITHKDYISGEHQYQYADIVRQSTIGSCGPEGKLWEKGGPNVSSNESSH